MASQDAAATTYEVDSAARSPRVQTSAGARAPRVAAARVPRTPERAMGSNALVVIGGNGLVNLKLASVTRRLVTFALEYTNGNVEWAADELGVDSATIRRWLHEWDAEQPPALAMVRP